MNAQISSEFIILEFISAPSVPFQMTLYAEKLFIDWGDGKCLSYDPQNIYFNLQHAYRTEEVHRIKIFGSKISFLSLTNQRVVNLLLSNCPSLEYLHCEGNELTELNLNNCPRLEELHCNSNNLTEFELPLHNHLNYLNLSHNSLSVLVLKNAYSLQRLYCSHCHLYELDLSDCRSINNLNVSHNFLSTSVLDRLVKSLPEKKATDYATLYFSMNPGVSKQQAQILQDKGWH